MQKISLFCLDYDGTIDEILTGLGNFKKHAHLFFDALNNFEKITYTKAVVAVISEAPNDYIEDRVQTLNYLAGKCGHNPYIRFLMSERNMVLRDLLGGEEHMFGGGKSIITSTFKQTKKEGAETLYGFASSENKVARVIFAGNERECDSCMMEANTGAAQKYFITPADSNIPAGFDIYKSPYNNYRGVVDGINYISQQLANPVNIETVFNFKDKTQDES